MKQELQKQIDQFKDQLRALSDKVNGLPEQEFEVGKWVKIISGGFGAMGATGRVGRVTNKPSQSTDYHGEDRDKTNVFIELPNGEVWGLGNRHIIEYATPSEVQEALTKEAVKRGFKEGVTIFRSEELRDKIRSCDGRTPHQITAIIHNNCFEYFPDEDLLMLNDYGIYCKGVWAEIVKDQPITICGKIVNYDNDCGMFSIDGQNYIPEDLKVLAKLMQKGQIKSLNVGCNGQEKVDLQLIEQLINRINKG